MHGPRDAGTRAPGAGVPRRGRREVRSPGGGMRVGGDNVSRTSVHPRLDRSDPDLGRAAEPISGRGSSSRAGGSSHPVRRQTAGAAGLPSFCAAQEPG